MLKLGSGFLKS